MRSIEKVNFHVVLLQFSLTVKGTISLLPNNSFRPVTDFLKIPHGETIFVGENIPFTLILGLKETIAKTDYRNFYK